MSLAAYAAAGIALSLSGLMLVFNQFWPNIVGVAVIAGILGANIIRAQHPAAA